MLKILRKQDLKIYFKLVLKVQQKHNMQLALLLFRPLKMGRIFVFGCVLVLYLYVFMQNQLSQKIIRENSEEYHIKDISVVIQRYFKEFKTISQCREKLV